MPDVLDAPAPPAAAPAAPASPLISTTQHFAPPSPDAPTEVLEPRHGDENMSDSLKSIRKLAGVKEAPEKPKAKEDEKPPDEKETATDVEALKKPDEAKKPDEVQPPKPPKAKELREAYDALKVKHAALEKEHEKIKAAKPDPASDPERKKLMDEHESLKKRFKEVDDEMRYVAYERSTEFNEKFQKPLDTQWAKALKKLQELEITDETTGETRAPTMDDMLTIVNLPEGRAWKMAKEMFGDSATSLMNQREKLRELSEAKEQAKADARTNGEKWEKEQREKFEESSSKINKEMGSAWVEAMTKDVEKLDWLKPVEGDQEGNDKLAQAKEKWIKAFVADPKDQNLTSQQRAEIVRSHAALVNRAIAYTPMNREIKSLRAQLAERDKALAEFRKSEPKQPELGSPEGKNGEPSVRDRILKYANR